MRLVRPLPFFLLMLAVVPASGSVTFVFTDWAVACDNTRRCQASGFQSDTSNSDPVALLLTREAGPGTPVQAVLMAQKETDGEIGALAVRAGTIKLDGIVPDAELSTQQLGKLMPQLLKVSSASVTDGKHTWTLSLAGIKAALLKMDDLQGRIDTPGALVRKGGKPEASALPPLPVPVLQATLAKTLSKDHQLLAPILKAMAKSDCDEDAGPRAMNEAELYRLSDSKVMVMRVCSRGAYQSGYGFWIASAKAPHAPKPLVFPSTGKDGVDLVMNAEFTDGVVSSFTKGRGPSDCGESSNWLWTADGFKLLDASSAPLCRGFAGGIALRTWVATRAGRAK